MPTVYSRNEKFTLCMEEYISMYDAYLKSEDPSFTPDLFWKLRTVEKDGYNIITYYLDISRTYTAYIVDTPYELDGIEYPAGPVIKVNQHNIDGFKEHFNNYFGDYEQIDENGVSQANVQLYESNEINGDVIRHKILVTYSNSYLLPFPIPHQCLSLYEVILLKEINKLTERCDKYKFRENKLKKKIINMREIGQINSERAAQTINRLYSNIDTNAECPVCYEEIKKDKLVVPACCHFICSDCSERWNNGCPMCRGEF